MGVLLLAGFLLRLYAMVPNTITNPHSESWLDEAWYLSLSIGTSTSPWQRLSTLLHGPVYFYLTDISFSIFGITYLAGRFFPVLFSSTTIILIYLLAKELYDTKLALFSAGIFSFLSPQIIFGSVGLFEPIYTALALLSMLLFIKWLKDEDKKKLWAAAALFGVAALTKIVVFYYLPAFIAYYFLARKETKLRKFAVPIVILLLLFSPVLLYNYFLYKDKGIADFHMTSWVNLPSSKTYYDSIKVTLPGISPNPGHVVTVLKRNITPIIFLFVIAGFYNLLQLRKKNEDLLVLSWFVSFITLYTLFVFHDYYLVVLSPLLAIISAKGLESLTEIFGQNQSKYVFIFLIFVFLASEFYAFSNITSDQSATYKLKEFSANLPKNSVIVSDPKLANTVALWVFNGAYGSPVQIFFETENLLYDKLNAVDDVKAYLYYVTCELEICGLDQITNARIDGLSKGYKQNVISDGTLVDEIYENNILMYRVYRVGSAFGAINGVITFPHQLIPSLKNPVMLAGYRVGKPELSDDVYSLHGPIDQFLNLIGHMALYIDILLALSAPILAFYLFLKDKDTLPD